ncbi:Nitrogenase FeMo-cofactor carrier protein NifX [Dehalobacter sp. UNSWDHB]|jgi:nitrogen fixation protein NifX|uniref:nitrogen fixation protein NifX n=1 Tax=unclassified Dehalobacter TaxID=2635733 RepID=UPI00028A7D80|nr:MULTISPECIES: nitrogen fixation protein NifX [unclassified Dehalobacter]AFV03030.1 Nitrogenase FeMo-cofactor carrier protein NifX [Dehalobacter sp. DCA]AFV06018.1 Nitrogenase FeMo-cofactor carrier protein NifX [Dehalobacter sp. CF]EQB22522.1 Nitrogenase FeMo-cofactor carrier protein NifX [Dehalobacter sp. UNSWDHB]
MLVAFATTGGEKINAHFGLATSFAVYNVTSVSSEFVQMINLPEQVLEDDKIEVRAEMLKECTVVYCTHIGGPAAARLVQSSIQPLKAVEGTPIESELQRLENMIKETPPPWLRKRLMEEMKNKEESCLCPCTKD